MPRPLATALALVALIVGMGIGAFIEYGHQPHSTPTLAATPPSTVLCVDAVGYLSATGDADGLRWAELLCGRTTP